MGIVEQARPAIKPSIMTSPEHERSDQLRWPSPDIALPALTQLWSLSRHQTGGTDGTAMDGTARWRAPQSVDGGRTHATRAQQREAKECRHTIRSQLLQRFPDADTEWTDPSEHPLPPWEIAGET
jgi:hypothetical protein